jgi:phosphatidylinositol-4,5-bisphosphate 3-kinase
MPPSSGELWGHHLMPATINVDCLLPNGVIIPLKCYRDSTLCTIKAELWREATNFPLFHLLNKDASNYIFVSITQDAEKEEFFDENRRLCDLRLFQPILKLVEPEGNLDEKIANSEIGQALGIHTHEFDEMKDPEVIEYRREIFRFVELCFNERNSNGRESQALYKFPPEIEDNPVLPPSMESKLDKGCIKIAIWSLSDTLDKQKHTIAVAHDATPEDIIREAIYFRIKKSDQVFFR